MTPMRTVDIVTCAVGAATILLAGVPSPARGASSCTATLADPFAPPAEKAACARGAASNPPPAQSVDSDNLYRALRVFGLMAITHPSPADLDLCRKLVAELDHRGAMRPADRRAWRETLLEYGRLDEVEADISAHAGHEDPALPRRVPLGTHPAGLARYWAWDPDANVLRERAVDLAHGTHLVVDASPGCHFCPLAAAAIDKDARLQRLFRNALWITRPESDFTDRYYRRWNASHPAEPMVVVLDVEGWMLPDSWSTPVFRFFHDGRVASTVMGWTATSASELLSAGQALGIGD